jgi:hypothetical protein
MTDIKLYYFTKNQKQKLATIKILDDDTLKILSIEDYENPAKNINFEEIEQKNKTTKQKLQFKHIISYLKAEWSLIRQGRVSNKIFNKRKNICSSCDKLKNPHTDKENLGWCGGGCGCQIGNPRAALSQKLYMPTLSCPINKFGPEKGSGINWSDIKNALNGLMISLKQLYKQYKENKN